MTVASKMTTPCSSSSSSRHCCNSNGRRNELKLSSYKLISESYATELDYEEENVFCLCGLKSPRRCSWTGTNPGRRFYGCQKYPVDHCRFMRWHDEMFTPRAVELINELRQRERFLYDQATAALESRQSSKLEEYVVGENVRLRHELDELKKFYGRENGRLRSELDEMKKKLGRQSANKHITSLRMFSFVLVSLILAYFVFGVS